MILRFFPAAVVALALAGCAEPQAPRLYVLEAPQPPSLRSVEARVIAVRELDLPAYARASSMARLAPDGSIEQSDAARWADAPPRAATTALASLIADMTGADVVTEPWSRDADPDVIVTVRVDRFVGALGGDVALTGRYSIIGAERRQERMSSAFSLTAAAGGPGYDALARAHGAALAALATLVVGDLR